MIITNSQNEKKYIIDGITQMMCSFKFDFIWTPSLSIHVVAHTSAVTDYILSERCNQKLPTMYFKITCPPEGLFSFPPVTWPPHLFSSFIHLFSISTCTLSRTNQSICPQIVGLNQVKMRDNVCGVIVRSISIILVTNALATRWRPRLSLAQHSSTRWKRYFREIQTENNKKTSQINVNNIVYPRITIKFMSQNGIKQF